MKRTVTLLNASESGVAPLKAPGVWASRAVAPPARRSITRIWRRSAWLSITTCGYDEESLEKSSAASRKGA